MRPPIGQSAHGVTPFQVRLVVVASLLVVLVGTLGWQLRRLTADDRWIAIAEQPLSRSSYVPTIRGEILDRDGRILAIEQARMSFEAHFETITGDWAFRQARRDARRALGSDWSALSESERHGATLDRIDRWQEAADGVWAVAAKVGDLDQAELASRREDVKAGVGRLRASVWDRRFDRLEQQYEE